MTPVQYLLRIKWIFKDSSKFFKLLSNPIFPHFIVFALPILQPFFYRKKEESDVKLFRLHDIYPIEPSNSKPICALILTVSKNVHKNKTMRKEELSVNNSLGRENVKSAKSDIGRILLNMYVQ